MILTTDEHGLTRNINSPTRYAREKIVRPKGDKNLNYPNLHGGMVTTTNYNKILTKKAIFMQKLIHIHQYKVDYC